MEDIKTSLVLCIGLSRAVLHNDV